MSEATFFMCHDGTGDWRVFARSEESENYVLNLSSMINEDLGEIGISVRTVSESAARERNLDYLGRLCDQWETWTYNCRLYEEGIDEDFPNHFPAQFKAWQSLVKLCEAVDAEVLRLAPVTDRSEVSDASKEESKTKTNWCYLADPPEGSKWKYGPVKCHLRQLASAIDQDEKTIRRWNGKSTYYVRLVNSRCFHVWFNSEYTFSEVRSKLPAS